MLNFLWVLVIFGALIGGFMFIANLGRAQSAPQEAALAAVCLAWAVIPYCLARAAQMLGRGSVDKKSDNTALLTSIDASLKEILQTELEQKKEREEHPATPNGPAQE